MKARFVVVDKNAGGNVHGVTQAQAFFNPRFGKQGFHFAGNVDKFPGFLCIEPQFFRDGFHSNQYIKKPRFFQAKTTGSASA
jgi:hypothetical protein